MFAFVVTVLAIQQGVRDYLMKATYVDPYSFETKGFKDSTTVDDVWHVSMCVSAHLPICRVFRMCQRHVVFRLRLALNFP